MSKWQHLRLLLNVFLMLGLFSSTVQASEDTRIVPSADYFIDHQDEHSLNDVMTFSQANWTYLGTDPDLVWL
ncbi:hypothetical protein [Aliidiomarina sanyensis]|uniref:Uncharacterized protein n=1 Tax=Aliidiomarina sanyensis TaxID=1249555 RepID=A0A432WKI2_9GAMM|nr:hypothetical protein [Aliidiomarina sanyensis]RUO34199.1 hypothetical protein CWE11_05575 [Aliidiomarina sanyensis]